MKPVNPATVRAESASSFPHPLAQIRSIYDLCEKTPGVTPTQVHVLIAIASHMDKHGRAFPSQATIVRKTKLSDRAVRDAIRALQRAGLLGIEAEPTPRKSTIYRIVLPVAPVQVNSGSEFRADRNLVPVKGTVRKQEEIQNAHAQTRTREEPGAQHAPVRGAGTRVGLAHATRVTDPVPGTRDRPATGLGANLGQEPPMLDQGSKIVAPVPVPGLTRAERSAQNKAQWAAKPRPGPTRVRLPKEPYRPYQLPLPQGQLVRDMDPDVRAAIFEKLKEFRLGQLGRSR